MRVPPRWMTAVSMWRMSLSLAAMKEVGIGKHRERTESHDCRGSADKGHAVHRAPRSRSGLLRSPFPDRESGNA
jgi:hypothetical protein